MATEIMGLLQRLKAKNKHLLVKHLLVKSKKVYKSILTLTPPTRTTLALTLVTSSSEPALMPSQCATL
eukprot:758586-Pelagomonas_calceolata.AAC.1